MSDLISTLAHYGLVGTLALAVGVVLAFCLLRSFWTIGPTEVGLVRKRFGGNRDDG